MIECLSSPLAGSFPRRPSTSSSSSISPGCVFRLLELAACLRRFLSMDWAEHLAVNQSLALCNCSPPLLLIRDLTEYMKRIINKTLFECLLLCCRSLSGPSSGVLPLQIQSHYSMKAFSMQLNGRKEKDSSSVSICPIKWSDAPAQRPSLCNLSGALDTCSAVDSIIVNYHCSLTDDTNFTQVSDWMCNTTNRWANSRRSCSWISIINGLSLKCVLSTL